MTEMSSLVIYQKHYDLILYAFPIIGRFPKNQRFTMGEQLQNKMMEIGTLIVYANKLKQKRGKLYEIDIKLEELRFLVRLAKDLGLISVSKYGLLSERLSEIGRLLGGWLKSES